MAWWKALLAWLFSPTIVYETPSVPIEPLPEAPEAPVSPVPELSALSLYYEAKPFVLTQKWGVYAPGLYKRFGFTNHNGIDIKHGINRRLRAPFDFVVYRTLWQPNGGGNVLTIVSTQEYDSPYGPAFVRIDYLHLAEYLKTRGSGKAGELTALAGNTGYSTGPHTHIKHCWVAKDGDNWRELAVNSADNSFDPMPFYNGEYAADI